MKANFNAAYQLINLIFSSVCKHGGAFMLMTYD